MATLTPSDIQRYSRQLILPQFGPSSQTTLKTSRVLIIGLGGLGSPAALYLSGAGIGTLGLSDNETDLVELSNLPRQPLHPESHLNLPKLTSALKTLHLHNPSTSLHTHPAITSTNAVPIIRKYHLVLDCTDTVLTRYLISDACAVTNTPLVSGAALALCGQLAVLCGPAPCYRCLFPVAPPPEAVGSCDANGVLAPVPGLIGTLQALEAIKVLTGVGDTLQGRLLLFDGGDAVFRTVKVRGKVDGCVACGEGKRIDVATFDYVAFVGGVGCAPRVTVEAKWRVSPEQFAAMRKKEKKKGGYRLVDVRPQVEFEICHLEEAESVPLETLESSDIFDRHANDKTHTVFICRRGNASQEAVQMALDHNIDDVADVIGGLQAWHHHVDKTFPLY